MSQKSSLPQAISSALGALPLDSNLRLIIELVRVSCAKDSCHKGTRVPSCRQIDLYPSIEVLLIFAYEIPYQIIRKQSTPCFNRNCPW
jgi:hypothetical protein